MMTFKLCFAACAMTKSMPWKTDSSYTPAAKCISVLWTALYLWAKKCSLQGMWIQPCGFIVPISITMSRLGEVGEQEQSFRPRGQKIGKCSSQLRLHSGSAAHSHATPWLQQFWASTFRHRYLQCQELKVNALKHRGGYFTADIFRGNNEGFIVKICRTKNKGCGVLTSATWLLSVRAAAPVRPWAVCLELTEIAFSIASYHLR